jgi:nitrogen fixation NifU-like protein
VLLEHNRRPRNARELADAEGTGLARNPYCGDEVRIQIRRDGSGRLGAVAFRAQSCAIGTASASLLTTAVAGLGPAEARRLAEEVLAALALPPGEPVPRVLAGELEALAGVRRFPLRIRCAQLPWQALVSAIAQLESD